MKLHPGLAGLCMLSLALGMGASLQGDELAVLGGMEANLDYAMLANVTLFYSYAVLK